MFDFITKHRRVAQIFLALIAITFATWGIESYTRFRGGRDTVASVNGLEISQREFAEQMRVQQEQVRRMFGGSIDAAALDTPEARLALLDSLIAQRVVGSEAAKQHLSMSRGAVIEAITQAPEFQENGKFSAARYSAYLASRGITDQRNVAELQSQLPLARFVGSIADTGIAPRAVAARLAALEAQKREVSEVRIPAQQFLAQVKIDEAQVKAHYDARQADYRTPERVRAEYVVLSAQNLARSEPVSEAEIKAAYEARVSQYRVEESRRAGHILVKSKEEADRLISELRKNPARFAELAKKHSLDAGSAEKGGDLGVVSKDSLASQALAEALFSMKQGEVQVAQSEFGFHVARVTGIQAAKPKSYDEVKKELADEIARQKGARKFAEAAENFSNLVYEQPESLKPAAERFKLQIQATGWIAKSASQELGALDNPKLLAALFSPDSIKHKRNTDAIEVAPNTLVAARVTEHQPAAQRKFEEVRGEIAEGLRRRAAADLAHRDGEAKLAGLRKGGDAGVKWGPVRTVSRRDAQGLPAEVLRRVVSADVSKLPAYVGIAFPEGGYLLLRISKVIDAGEQQPDPQSAARIASLFGGSQYEAYVEALRSRADIEINPANLEKK